MHLDTYQAAAMRTAKALGETGDLMHAALGLCGEAGEFCTVAQQQVPADFQKTPNACTDWVWDEIPF